MSSKPIATVMAVVLLLSASSLAQSQSGQSPASSAGQDKSSKHKPVSSGEDQVITIVLPGGVAPLAVPDEAGGWAIQIKDRKSTRLNSSHGYISYAVFCLKKKTKNGTLTNIP